MFARKISRPQRLIPYPHTNDFRSRIVDLPPGKSIGAHSTKNSEELIIVLEGKLDVTDFRRRACVSAPSAVLIPAKTRHDVQNKSKKLARYVYVIRRDSS